MPFYFLKYLQPVHYFRLKTKKGRTIFPKVDALPVSVRSQLSPNHYFQSDLAREYDLSWQAVHQGYIGDAPVYEHFEPLSVQDNYCFIRGYFHSAWVLYVLFVRIITFHNPLKEIKAWHLSRTYQPKSLGHIVYPDWQKFQSSLIASNPKVSVLIPTLNRYGFLKNILQDFEKQDYSNFEVIVIDQSDVFNESFYSDFNLDLQLIRQEEKALWLARNNGIKASKGSLIALSEDDVRIEPNWLSNHLKCLDFFNCSVSAGVFYPEGKQIPKSRSFFAIGTQFATGNAMLYKDVFKTVGLFDRQFEKQRMGDGEFGLRLYLNDIKSISNPKASCIDVKADTGGLRDMGSWDAFRPSTLFAPRPIPSVLYYYRRYYGAPAARWALLRSIPMSIIPYQFKKNKPLLILGIFISLLLLPVVCFQVYRSWQLASEKLNEGAKIEEF